MNRMDSMNITTGGGIVFGCALAIVISYMENHSIPWAILHGIFSWFFVVYAATTY